MLKENLNPSVEYNIKNCEVELINDYFDVVPDGNIFTNDMVPVFAIRLKYEGIHRIAKYYEDKYHIIIDVIPFLLHSNSFTMYSNDATIIFDDSNELNKYINFDDLKDNAAKGIIITVLNKNRRLVHAIPMIYGIKKDIGQFALFLDPYYEFLSEADMDCSTMQYATFMKKHFPNITLFAHKTKIQADHHSCGIIACDSIKNYLVMNAKITFNTIKKAFDRNKYHASTIIDGFYEFELHNEILKLSQITKNIQNNTGENISKNNINFSDYINKYLINVKYYREPAPYNPNDFLIPQDAENLEIKKINSKLLQKGHEYAKLILKLSPENNKSTILQQYNPTYWLKLIQSQKTKSLGKIIGFFKELRTQIKNK